MVAEVTHSYHPFCVTAVCLKLRLVIKVTVSFQTEGQLKPHCRRHVHLD